MADFDNTNRGVLFKNENKEPGDKRPDYTGNLNIDGVECFLDGWIRKSQAGKTFLSVSVKKKDKQAAKPAQKPTQKPSSGFDDLDSEVPF